MYIYIYQTQVKKHTHTHTHYDVAHWSCPVSGKPKQLKP